MLIETFNNQVKDGDLVVVDGLMALYMADVLYAECDKFSRNYYAVSDLRKLNGNVRCYRVPDYVVNDEITLEHSARKRLVDYVHTHLRLPQRYFKNTTAVNGGKFGHAYLSADGTVHIYMGRCRIMRVYANGDMKAEDGAIYIDVAWRVNIDEYVASDKELIDANWEQPLVENNTVHIQDVDSVSARSNTRRFAADLGVIPGLEQRAPVITIVNDKTQATTTLYTVK